MLIDMLNGAEIRFNQIFLFTSQKYSRLCQVMILPTPCTKSENDFDCKFISVRSLSRHGYNRQLSLDNGERISSMKAHLLGLQCVDFTSMLW